MNSLRVRVVSAIMSVVILALIFDMLFIEYLVKRSLKEELENNALNLLEATYNNVETQYRNILFYKSSMLERRKTDLKNSMDIVFAQIGDEYRRYRDGLISEKSAKERVISILKRTRYDGGMGYFWINDTSRPFPSMIMHPVMPWLDGKILDDKRYNVALDRNENLFKAFVDICLAQGDGYVGYLWPKPDDTSFSHPEKKLSYVRLFKPWGWIIGTGVYLDTIERDVNRQISSIIDSLNSILPKQKIGKSGYFFIFDKNDRMLVHPLLKGADGSKFLDPETSVPLMDEFKSKYNDGIVSMEYKWSEKGRFRLRSKKAFIAYFKPLGWYIVSSVYKDDFEGRIRDLEGLILIMFSVLTLISFSIAVFMAKSIIQPVTGLIESIRKQDSDGLPVERVPEQGPWEIKVLGSAINKMIDTAARSRKMYQDSEKHYRNLFNNALVGIFRTRIEDGMFIEVNRRGAELLGFEPEDMIDKVRSPELYNDPSVRKILLEELARKGEVHNMEVEFRRPDGIKVICSLSIRAYPEDGYMEGVVIDITKSKEMEKEKRRLQEQLVHRSKLDAIGQLAGGIAHDFNNMLTGIMGAAHYLRAPKRNLSDKELQMVDIILQSAVRAADLTSKLLAFGRKGKISSAPEDIHRIIDTTVDILEKTINRKIRIMTVKKAECHTVTGDNTSLHNVFLNLGINAHHAMPGGGILSFETENCFLDEDYCRRSTFDITPGMYVKISVMDTGSGIPEGMINRIFEPFFTTKEQGEGTGLGLSVVYGTILEHHGVIEVESEVDAGTLFSIYLPCCDKEPGEKSSDESEVEEGSGTILFVDDEEIVRKSGRIMIEELGYNVIVAGSGEAALDIYSDNIGRIDLVITDMIMPDIGGKEVFYRLKEIDRHCKVVIATGFSKEEDIAILKEDGLDGFIFKPFTIADLSRAISSVLKSR